MNLIEIEKLYDSSMFNLAMCVKSCMKLELRKVMDIDDVMQDHLAEALDYMDFGSDANSKKCLEFLRIAIKAIKVAIEQEKSLSKYYSSLETDEPLIAKMLMGYIGFEVDKDLVELSRKVKKIADLVLAKKKKNMSEDECKQLVREFFISVIPMAKEYGCYLTDNDGTLDLNGLYLKGWFWKKCMTE